MSKIKLDLNAIMSLNLELKEMMKEPAVNFVVKYELAKFIEETDAIVKRYNDQRNAIVEKYGVLIDKEKGLYDLTGDNKAGLDELNKLNEIGETFDFQFKIDDFKDVKSTSSYIVIMKFIK